MSHFDSDLQLKLEWDDLMDRERRLAAILSQAKDLAHQLDGSSDISPQEKQRMRNEMFRFAVKVIGRLNIDPGRNTVLNLARLLKIIPMSPCPKQTSGPDPGTATAATATATAGSEVDLEKELEELISRLAVCD